MSKHVITNIATGNEQCVIVSAVWTLRSCQQMSTLLRHVLRVFRESLPHALISERWAQTALQLGLSCPSRHYAGRSLQVLQPVLWIYLLNIL